MMSEYLYERQFQQKKTCNASCLLFLFIYDFFLLVHNVAVVTCSTPPPPNQMAIFPR